MNRDLANIRHSFEETSKGFSQKEISRVAPPCCSKIKQYNFYRKLENPTSGQCHNWALETWDAIPCDLVERPFPHCGCFRYKLFRKFYPKLLVLQKIKADLEKRIQEPLIDPSDDPWEISQRIKDKGYELAQRPAPALDNLQEKY